MLVSVLLCLAADPGAPAAPQWRVDVPIALVAQPPTSADGARVAPWLGLRAAYMLEAPPDQLVVLGGDVAAMLGYGPNEGTSRVHAARVGAAIDARGIVALNVLHSATTWLRPYGFAGAELGGATAVVTAYDAQRYRLLPVWGARAGLGLELTVRVLSLRVDLGAGVRTGELALDSRFAVGAAF